MNGFKINNELKQIAWLETSKNFSDKGFKIILQEKEQPIYLTHREATVVALMMLGDRAKQIAWKLKISLHTVNSHMANIKHKLKCSTNFEVGYRLGWFWYYQERES
jgi:DNA-binding CsgD family transcriptional regulator